MNILRMFGSLKSRASESDLAPTDGRGAVGILNDVASDDGGEE
jgi:hypothetical protein